MEYCESCEPSPLIMLPGRLPEDASSDNTADAEKAIRIAPGKERGINT
jgi:hypothetical protein